MDKGTPRHQVLFYTKKGCHLCDDAREIALRAQRDFSIDLHEVNIESDHALFERYKEIIPVMIIDGQITLGARVEEDELREALLEMEKLTH